MHPDKFNARHIVALLARLGVATAVAFSGFGFAEWGTQQAHAIPVADGGAVVGEQAEDPAETTDPADAVESTLSAETSLTAESGDVVSLAVTQSVDAALSGQTAGVVTAPASKSKSLTKAPAPKPKPKAKKKAKKAKKIKWKSAKCSWYGPGFYGNTMAGGGKLKRNSMVVAHRSLPFGTKVQIKYKGRTVTAVVRDRGPYVGGRVFDLGPGTAKKLKFSGVGTVKYRIVKRAKR